MLRLPNHGPGFISTAILKWAGDIGVAWHDIDPAKPLPNGLIESFNGSLRPLGDASIARRTMDECLNEEIFDSLAGGARSCPSV